MDGVLLDLRDEVKEFSSSFHFTSTALYALMIATGFALTSKLLLQCLKYYRIPSTRKLEFLNPLGNLVDFIRNARIDGLSLNVYFLQTLMGYCQLYKNDSFFYVWFSFKPFIIAKSAKAVEELISGSKNMEKAWIYDLVHAWLGRGLLTSYGRKWKSRRKLLTPSFHFDILKDFLPVFNEQSQTLVKLLENEIERPWTDVVKHVTLCSLDIVCETTIGVSVGAQKDSESEYVQAVSRASDATMNRLTHPPHYVDWCFNLSSVGSQFKKDLKLLHNFTRKVISDKKQKLLSGETDVFKKKRKALMDLLLEQHIQNKALTEDDIREEIDTFVFAGHDTTSMGISWALYMIGLHKDVQDNISEEMERIFGDDDSRHVTVDDLKDMNYLERVLKETQRLYPSVPFFARKLSDDLTICGRKVSKEVSAIVFTYALHRDETVFPNPEKFDPDRFLPENSAKRSPFAYIPFSAGPRNCIGQRFALMEEKVIIANILRNYRLESLDPRDKVPAAAELILRAACPLRIKFESRRPTKPSGEFGS